mmetsp:Transcript_6206/g.13533  ORF Transcript_6206/g.13533 Transcript_6206/m.13533 type:complete len:322 (-) Transcript_6206:644-1609(-)
MVVPAGMRGLASIVGRVHFGVSTCKPSSESLLALQQLSWPWMASVRPLSSQNPLSPTSIQEVFNIPKLLHPDIYDVNENRFCSIYKTHGKVMDPYYKRFPLKSWNLWANDHEGFDELERRARFMFNRWWALRVCFQSVYGFRPKALKLKAIDMYKQINDAIAQASRSARALEDIRNLVVPTLYDQLKGEAQRMRAAGREVEWKLVKEPSLSDVELVNGYMAKAVENAEVPIKLRFVQWTVAITSEQSFAVYEKVPKSGARRLVAGDPNQVLKVVDHWVLERPIFKAWVIPRTGPQGAAWRLLARLAVPDEPPKPKVNETQQ